MSFTHQRLAELLSAVKVPEDAAIPAPIPLSASSASLLLSKAYFDVKEYRRAAAVISPFRDGFEVANSADPTSRFLFYYALYLAGEKAKQEVLTLFCVYSHIDMCAAGGIAMAHSLTPSELCSE